ncbi:hypothetical protein DRE_02690 [Drechslerella stenobrocha 248]|uniref:EF-hand domain-containing protein n=1 Tax=Drechslerella stenobrocha 248 TaxID=1043628 RepID=W7HV99_9PEZI|nr:hypothetical protein DRE_02690 [Drechslerella stenobrocha 248]
MADPLGGGGHDTSIDSVLSEGSSVASKGSTPRRAHPAFFPKPTTSETHGTVRASRFASPPPRRANSDLSDAFIPDQSEQESPTKASRSRRNSVRGRERGSFSDYRERGSPPPTTPSNPNGGKGSKGRSSTARRSKMKSRKSISIAGAGASEDESSASDTENTSEKIFEQAFKKFDKKDDDHIPMADFLHFFDTLQGQLPPLSEPLLQPGVREQMLAMMSQVMSQSDSSIFISKEETKTFYRAIAGKDITQELNDRRQGTFAQSGEVSSFKGRLVAAQIPDGTPRRPSAANSEHRTPFSGAFARPAGPRRQQSNNLDPMGEGDYDEVSDVQSIEPSEELTGNPLASSTPAAASKRPGRGYFSPPVTSPTQSSLSFNETPGRSAFGSPGFNTSAHLEADLAAVHRELRQKQQDFIEKEQELSELRHRAERNREEFEDEIVVLNEEITRARNEVEGRRRENVELNKEKDELRAEAAVYLDQISDSKKEIESLHRQHDEDRDTLMSLNQENHRYAKQFDDAMRRVDALTEDLRTVIGQKKEVEAQCQSLQRKADLVTGLHKQIKDLKKDLDDKKAEIERLGSEVNRREMDLNMYAGNLTGAAGARGGGRNSMGPDVLGLLSDELEGVGSEDDDEDEGAEDEEEEEVVTTTKTIKRRKKPSAQKKVDATSGIPDTADEPFELVERIADTTERGIQVDTNPPWTASSGTGMDEDDLPVPMFTAVTQTDISVPALASLEDHLSPPLEFSMDEASLNTIAEYRARARDSELTASQLEELSKLVGVQAQVLEQLTKLGEANAAHRSHRVVVKEKLIPGEDPIAYLNYATYWLQTWLRLTIAGKTRIGEKGASASDEWVQFVEHNPQPSMAAVVTLLVLFFVVFAMTGVLAVYSYRWQTHEAMWRRLNSLQGYPRHPGAATGTLFGSRTWRVFKYDLQRMLNGQVRFPV